MNGCNDRRRIISNYINLPKRYFSRINHHPLITTIVFAPFIKYPKNHISMSNFDIFAKIGIDQFYLNHIPLIGAIKSLSKGDSNSMLLMIIKILIFLYTSLNRIVPAIDKLVGFFLRRIYISNIYLESKYSSSYLNSNKAKTTIIGGFRADLEKNVIYKKIPILFTKLLTKKVLSGEKSSLTRIKSS